MYKVLVVDDEIYVVSLIVKLIDWDKLEMSVIDTANDGVTALEKVELLEPDIVIVDVRMPGCDGITFMKRVREINDRVRFIVISGHKKFEYAKSAMQHNVEDYVLKPINKVEVEEILLKLKYKLDEEKSQRENLQLLDSQLGSSKIKLIDYVEEQVWQNNQNVLQQKVDNLNEMYFTNFIVGKYQYVIFKVDTSAKDVDKEFNDTLLKKISGYIETCIARQCNQYFIRLNRGEIHCVLNYIEQKEKDVMLVLQAILQEIRKILEKFEKLYFTICVGDCESELSQLQNSKEGALRCVKARVVLGVNKILFTKMLQIDTGAYKVVLTDQVLEKYMSAIKSLDMSKIHESVREIFSRAEGYETSHTLIFEEVVWGLHKLFYEYVSKVYVYKKSYEYMKEELDNDLVTAYTMRQFSKCLEKQMEDCLVKFVDGNNSSENPAVRIAKRYVVENYMKNISITSISEVVNLNSVYFGILFKKETDVNFLDYLNQYRVEEAKKMLKDVSYNINEISSQVGYQDSKYFSKIFKKIVGVTPTEYRRRSV